MMLCFLRINFKKERFLIPEFFNTLLRAEFDR